MTCTGSTAPDEQGENQQPWKRCVVSPIIERDACTARFVRRFPRVRDGVGSLHRRCLEQDDGFTPFLLGTPSL